VTEKLHWENEEIDILSPDLEGPMGEGKIDTILVDGTFKGIPGVPSPFPLAASGKRAGTC